MKRRRLRKLVPDAELIGRRAAGATLRELACDYGVAHTTLGRYFARPEVKTQLGQAGRQLRAEERALAARRLAERRLEPEVRRSAEAQAAAEREQQRRFRAALAEHMSRRRPPRSAYEAWLDEREAPRPSLSRADLHSQHDQTAASVVSQGGGIRAVLAATDLRTLDNVARLIDPAILTQAFDNDARAQPQPLAVQRRPRPRRLLADAELLRRRAAGTTLRALACDYDVAHTTLSRFFARAEITKQLRQTRQQLRAQQRARAAARRSASRRSTNTPAARPQASWPPHPEQAHPARAATSTD